jgi:hypothetical protein
MKYYFAYQNEILPADFYSLPICHSQITEKKLDLNKKQKPCQQQQKIKE